MRRLVALSAVLATALSVVVLAAAPAQAAAVADLVVAQTALDFGDVRMGTTSAIQRATLVNRGTTTVKLTGDYAAGGVFTQKGSCRGAVLAPGAQCSLAVTFRPKAPGTVVVTLTATFAGVPVRITARGRGLGLFAVSPVGLDFGDVAIGSNGAPQTVRVTNVSGVSQVVAVVGGGGGLFGGSQSCQGRTLAPGGSCELTYRFAPTALGAAAVTARGTFSGQPYAIALRGTGVRQFSISPTSFDFGDVALGDPSPEQTVTVTNRGTADATVSIAGGAAGLFGGAQNCQGVTLPPGASCQISYRFAPTALGAATGTTNGTLNGQPFAFAFRGNGIPRFRISPTTFDFGEVAVGSSAPAQAVTVTNRGGSPATVGIAGGAAGPFGGSQNCQGVTLAPGASCQVFYAFAPTTGGVQTGSTNGSVNGQPFAFSFRGTGTPGTPTQAFRISPTSFDFGSTSVGSVAPQQTVTITNTSTSPVVGSIAGGAAGQFGGSQNCQGVTIAPGASCQVNYTFAPNATGAVTGSTSGSFNGQPFAFSFRGTGVRQWVISPLRFDFGDTRPGVDAPQTVTVRNVGTSPAVGSIAGGAAGQFGGSQNCQGVTIPAGGSCQVSYRFGPTATGPVTGTTSGSFNGQPFAFSFAGNGRPRWLVSPTAFDFGDVALGTSAPSQAVTVQNLGGDAVKGAIAGGAAGPYGGSQNCQGVTIAVGASCQVSYGFGPTSPGLVPASTAGTFNGQPFAFTFTGYARRDLLVSPLGLDLSRVPVGGTSRVREVAVTNVSGATRTLTATRPPATAPFSVKTTCAGAVLAPGASCVYRFTFRPTASGRKTVTYTAAVNRVRFVATLTGTGG